MPLNGFTEMLRRRRRRRDYRAMVKKWYADGGDDRYRFDYDLDERSLVLDLGGYEGQWASDLYARQRCRIAIFEPVARFARNIEARFRKNNDITVFACGLGAATRTETIYVHGASSSTHKKQAQSEQIEIVDVKEWFDDHSIDAVQRAGYRPGENVWVLLDPAASELYHDGSYTLERDNKTLTPTDMAAYWEAWARFLATHAPGG